MNRQEALWVLQGKIETLTDEQVEEVYGYAKHITEREEVEETFPDMMSIAMSIFEVSKGEEGEKVHGNGNKKVGKPRGNKPRKNGQKAS